MLSVTLEEFLRNLLDDERPLQSYFEETCEGRFQACTPGCWDEEMCLATAG